LILEEDNIDRGPDWRNYSDSEEDKSRAEYTSKRFYDDNMGSEIGRQPNGTSGVSAAKRKQLSRLRREQSRAKLSNGNNRLSNLLGEANRMASALGLSKVIVDGACNLIRAVHSEYSITGHSIESIASAAVYLSARELNEPVSLENITRVSRVSRKAITTSRQKICNDLGLEIEPASPTDYFAQLVPDLDLDTETIHESRTILKAMEERHPEVWAGAHPLSKVGAALYLASFYTGDLGRVSVPTIADQVGRSEEAVTDRYSDIVGSLTLSELVDSRHSPSA
jgi:transcription initiation factor TFIIB